MIQKFLWIKKDRLTKTLLKALMIRDSMRNVFVLGYFSHGSVKFFHVDLKKNKPCYACTCAYHRWFFLSFGYEMAPKELGIEAMAHSL